MGDLVVADVAIITANYLIASGAKCEIPLSRQNNDTDAIIVTGRIKSIT